MHNFVLICLTFQVTLDNDLNEIQISISVAVFNWVGMTFKLQEFCGYQCENWLSFYENLFLILVRNLRKYESFMF